MPSSVPSELRILFFAHAIVVSFFGIFLWVIPGRTLVFLGWVESGAFVDPLLTRLLGAALLALAFSSYQGWRARRWTQVELLVQLEAVFCLLGIVAILAMSYLLGTPLLQTLRGWILLLVLGGFGITWGVWAWRRHAIKRVARRGY
jgi:hypothetical protein